MSAFSDYLEAAILNAVFRNTEFPAPQPATYLALFKSDPGDANAAGAELINVNGNSPGYARIAVSAAGGWSAPGAGAGASTITNQNALEFPEAQGNWAQDVGGNPSAITHFGLFDAAQGGNLLLYGALDTPRIIAAGDVIRFSAGALTIQIA